MGRSVNLSVQVRRFKCINPQCSRTTFVEQIDNLAQAKQRRTVGLSGAWCAMAQALGGSAAARLSAKLGMPASRDTLLRELRRLGSEGTTAPPVVVGIDDWAITRGHRYGTIVVDLERRCPIEVLDGRESTNVADWLKRHPSIQVVARDRAGAYSDAAQRVIPHAQQVADRWHLLGNLRETVERLLLRHNARLREAAQLQLVAVSPLPQTQPAGADSVLPLMAWQKLSIDRRTARLGRYEEVVRLRAQGLSCKAIGRAMDLDQRTVSHFVRSGEYPERSPRGSGPMLLDAYRHCLCQRVAQGCTNITALWHELQAQGFKGSRGTVRVAMAHAYAVSSSTDTAGRPGRRASTPSAQRAYAWLVGWDERGNQVPKRAEHRQFVEALCAIEPQIAQASSLAREFLGLIHRRDVAGFDRWLARARDGKAPEIRRFAGSMTADLSAVRAAFELPWSSGQVEGQINRLKFLKRQMYGRAKLDLLRAPGPASKLMSSDVTRSA
jgi:transposase